MKFNIIDKFLFKLLFLTFILLSVVVLDNKGIISLNNVKKYLNENINITTVVKKVNGELNLIDLGDEVIEVSKNDYYIEKYDNYYKYYIKENKVYNQSLGSVIKINKINGLYVVTILDENDNEFIYYDLKDVNVKIYQIIKVNDVIGIGNNSENEDYLYYFKLKINEN